MRKALALWLIWGWFFMAQSPLKEGSDAVITTHVGMFKTQAECVKNYDELKEMLEALGIPHRTQPCTYRQET
jgi:hypothetical protein